jgi:hypothetical protein
MKRCWKPLLLALVLAAGGTFGFLATDAQADSKCGQVCCPETGKCYSCFSGWGGGCLCPDIACP